MKKTLAFSILLSGALLGYWACTTDDIAGPTAMPPCPTISISGAGTVCSGTTVTLSATASYGTLPYTFLWSTTETTQTIMVTPTVTTPYSVAVTDAGGCSKASGGIVVVNPEVAVTASVTPLTGNSFATDIPDVGGTTFSFTGSAIGGIAPTYSWSFGDTNTATIQNPTHTYAAPGTYSVTLTVTDCGLPTTDPSISIVVS